MSRESTSANSLTIGQLAKRWSVAEARIRQLIEAGKIMGVFRIPSAGRYRETTKIPLASIQTAEREWAVVPSTARQQQTKRQRSSRSLPTFKHFPELINDQEPAAESHEADPN
jgi:hypothetical protein